MKVCTDLILFNLFAYIRTHSDNERNVNMIRETVEDFSDEDNNSGDLLFPDNVEKIITEVKSHMKKNNYSDDRRNVAVPKINMLFTDFILKLIAILNTYDDIASAHFFHVLDDEISKYDYEGCEFHELMKSYKIRELFTTKLLEIRGKSSSAVKNYFNLLARVLKNEMYEEHVKDLVEYINSLYKQDAIENFKRVLVNLESFNKSESKRKFTDLTKTIRDGIRSIIFDHYTNLNRNTRWELKLKLERFWKQQRILSTLLQNIPQKVTIAIKKPTKHVILYNRGQINEIVQRKGRENINFEYSEAKTEIVDGTQASVKQSVGSNRIKQDRLYESRSDTLKKEKGNKKFKTKYKKRRPEIESGTDKQHSRLIIDNNVMTDVIGSTMDMNAYQKSKDITPTRTSFRQATISRNATPANRWIPSSPSTRYVKRHYIRSSHHRHYTTNKEGTAELTETKTKRTVSLKKIYTNINASTVDIDGIIIKTLDNQEKELNDSKSKLGEGETEARIPEWKYEATEEKDKVPDYLKRKTIIVEDKRPILLKKQLMQRRLIKMYSANDTPTIETTTLRTGKEKTVYSEGWWGDRGAFY